MARAGSKLARLIKSSVMKKWSSFGSSSSSSKTSPRSIDDDSSSSASASSRDLRQVYVGKSRRRYLVNSEVADHPVFRELAGRESGGGDAMNVACEVVLFEHLLWMLESSESHLDELVDFYC